MAEGRLDRRRWLTVAAAVLLLAGAALGWWWRSAHAPAELPASACWSVLTRADLKPLAEQAHGTLVERNSTDGSHEYLRPIQGELDCRVEKNPGSGLLWVQVWSMGETAMEIKYGPESDHQGYSRLDFGADVQGWVRRGQVGMVFRCDNPENARLGRPYTAVGVAAGELTDLTSAKVHRAVLDIALKYAKRVVADYPCSNPLHLPDSVPESATNFPPLGP